MLKRRHTFAASRDLPLERPRRRDLARVMLLATVIGTLALLGLLLALPDRDGITRATAGTGPALLTNPTPATPRAIVTIPRRPVVERVPRSFLGLSTEYWALPIFERHMALLERALSLLRVRGDGPLVIRVGGDSADHTVWNPAMRNPPPWMFALTPPWVRHLRTLVTRTGMHVILDLNLITGSPLLAARWARIAESDLPRGSIIGFEIGNEPDLYSRWFWLGLTARNRLGLGAASMLLSPLPNVLSPAMYVRAFHAYSRALAPVAARVPLIGPAVANPVVDANWITSLLRSSHHRLGIVSAHRYPYSGCASRKSLSYPTIGRVLSELATAGMAQSLRPAVMLAHRAGLPFQMTELNSVTCGGLRGVSDSFATALWAPDALFELMRVGVAGVDIHVRARAINAAFVLTRQGLIARPLLYGLVLFTRTLGEDPRLVDLGLRADPRLHLKAWAVRVRGGGLHVLLINKGHRAAAVDVRVRGVGPAAAEQLLAPSAAARSGVTLNGQQLGPGGRWQGLPATQTVAARRRGYELTVSPTSAVLLRLRLR